MAHRSRPTSPLHGRPLFRTVTVTLSDAVSPPSSVTVT